MSATVLKVRGLRKEFTGGDRPVLALRDVAFDVSAGEFVCIVGPSGSGKSTLLAMIAGLDPPTRGHLLLDDRPITGPGNDRGMVFQRDCLFPWLTVEENVEFATRLAHGRSARPESVRERSRALLAEVGLEQFARAYPKHLSGGMRQRAAIARALLCQPRILLMDEPFGALDAQTREQMQDLLLGLCRHGSTTVLFVTHDVEEAVLLGDRVLVLSAHPGEVAAEVHVPLSRPRNAEQKLEPEFARVRRDVVNAVRAAHRAEVA